MHRENNARGPIIASVMALLIISLGFVMMMPQKMANALQTTITVDSRLSTSTAIPAGTVAKDEYDFEMAYIPGGKFQMGISRDDFLNVCQNVFKAGDQSRCSGLADVIGKETGIFETYFVEIPSFWMDRYEISIEQYAPCIAQKPGKACEPISIASGPKLTDDPRKPQVGVNWYDAIFFCNKRGARLPTEEEWEYAAKGSHNLVLPWGNSFVESNISPIDATYPVGSVPGNKSWAGIYDLAGNAAEWVENRFVPYKVGGDWPQGDTIEIARVIRGGSWANRTIQLATFDREFAKPGEPDWTIGFRCARSSDPRKF